MEGTSVYVFSGRFKSIDEACLYSQAQWEPEPNELVSDEEYSEWEERNPTHELRKNIPGYLDEDFIETVAMSFNYLSDIGMNESDIAKVLNKANGSNILVLVYEKALGGFNLKYEPVSNSNFFYCGHYKCKL